MRQRLLILGIILAILVGTYVAGSVAYAPRPPERREAFSGFDRPDGITVERPDGQSVDLELGESGWVVRDEPLTYPARSRRVEDLLTAVKELTIGRRVSGSEDALEELGLVADSAYTLRIAQGDRAASILVGKAGTTPETAYGRFRTSTEAHLLHGGIRFYLTQRPSFWADLRVFFESFKPDDVVRMDFEALPTETVTGTARERTVLFRSQDSWQLEGTDGEIDQRRASELARTATTFEATRFVPYEVDVDWSRVIRLHLDDGRVFSMYSTDAEGEVRVMAEGPGLPIDANGLPYHYRAGAAAVDRLFRDIPGLLTVE